MLDPAFLDGRLSADDAERSARYPGPSLGRLPVHTAYVPADRYDRGTAGAWGAAALAALERHGPVPGVPADIADRVAAKLRTEPVEDLRIDFEDGYGLRPDDEEDAAARAAARALHEAPTAFSGLRIKSLEGPTRHRGVRTLDVFLDALGPPPPGFRVTLPKVSSVAQVEAMLVLSDALGGVPFELQVEMPQAVLGADGTATVARMVHTAGGRCAGLHYGTYDYSAALGIAPAQQAMDHPVADHAKAVLQVAAAMTGVPVSDGSTNVLPVGDGVHAAWALHLRLVRRSLERGLYQGWDLHPAQLPTRYAATFAFYREGAPTAVDRLRTYLLRATGGFADEPATAKALAGYLLRGLQCGALDPSDVPFDDLTTIARTGAAAS